MCFKRSCASSKKMIDAWNKTNKKSPRQVALFSNTKVLVQCNDCKNSFTSSPSSISAGYWCPICKNKTEKKAYNFLKEFYGHKYTVTHQKKLESCKNPETGRYLPLDYCIEELKLIIELDGPQHFRDIKFFRKTKEQALARDLFKTRACLSEGYSVIRLLQEDVWRDQNSWQGRLLVEIEEPQTTSPSPPRTVFLDNHGEYDPLRLALLDT
jgi:very-short-patch-repair endonuclease